MAKTASSFPKFDLPKFEMPKFAFPTFAAPKFDLAALFALQKANLAAAHEAQAVLLEATQALVQLGYASFQDNLSQAQAALSAKEPKQPQALVAEVQAATEKALSVTKQGVDLQVAAQRKVADLVAKRVAANVEELKALAA